HQGGVNAHRPAEALLKPFPDERDAHDRERALAESAGQCYRDEERDDPAGDAHTEDRGCEQCEDTGQHQPRAEPVDESTNPQAERSTDQRRPEIELTVVESVEAD